MHLKLNINSLSGKACPFDKINRLALARVKYQSVPLPLNGLNTQLWIAPMVQSCSL